MSASEKKNQLLKRDEVPSENCWRTSDIYPNDAMWEKDSAQLMDHIALFKKYKGKLGDGFHVFLEAIEAFMDIALDIEKNAIYAYLRFHEDMTDAKRQAMSQTADRLTTAFDTATAYLVPEIMQLPSVVLSGYIGQTEMGKYKHFMNNLLREKDHILTQKEEVLLAGFKDIGGAPSTIFSMINDADMKFPDINAQDGELLPLTKGRYTSYLRSENRKIRQDAYEKLHDTYRANQNTLAATYYASVKRDSFEAQTRKYSSSLHMALADDNIDESVYENLTATVREALPLLHRYLDIKKRALGLDNLHMYDLYTPLVRGIDYKVSYDQAKTIVTKALEPLGSRYVSALASGLENGWIDVYENIGKRGGAYAWGCSASHPFVLLNYDNSIDSLFTLAHEMGHAMHSYYTWKKQPYVYSGHKIFVAEVASTVNEALLMDYMLETAEDSALKKYILNYYLEQFRATFFRQTLFAEFEKATHAIEEVGGPLTADTLCKIYRELNEAYYKGVIMDERIDIEWARIPHFYNAFYVYQYATGFSAAITLSQGILGNHLGAVKRYIQFLESGCSEYSVNLLQAAGADMTSTTPIKTALSVFEKLLDDMEESI